MTYEQELIYWQLKAYLHYSAMRRKVELQREIETNKIVSDTVDYFVNMVVPVKG